MCQCSIDIYTCCENIKTGELLGKVCACIPAGLLILAPDKNNLYNLLCGSICYYYTLH